MRRARLKLGVSPSQICEMRAGEQPTFSAKRYRLLPCSVNHSLSVMRGNLSDTEILVNPKFKPHRMATHRGRADYPRVIKSELALKARAWRKRAKLTLEDVAAGTDMTPSNLSQLERGIIGFSDDSLQKLATFFGCTIGQLFEDPPENMPSGSPVRAVASLPVKCVAKAGYWAEPEMLQDAQENNEYGQFISIPPRPGYDVEPQYAVRIDGNSINKIAPSGAYAICVRYDAWPGGEDIEKLAGRFVHVERTRGGLIENTIKKLVMTNGAPALWPYSHDTRHQTPVPLGNGDDDTISILGVVLGFYSDAPTS